MRSLNPSLLSLSALLGLGLLFAFASAPVAAQQAEFDRALAASRASGTPILVIAGRETCPNCQNLMEQLSQRELAPIAASLVTVKVDVDGAQWPQFVSKFGNPDGNLLPFVYVIRADGETLHSHSGPMDSGDLANVIVGQMQRAGRALNARQLETITQVVAAAKTEIEQGNYGQAVRTLQPLKQIGELGQIGSYAQCAVEADQLVADLNKQVTERLADVSERLASQDQVLEACFDVVQAKRIYASIPAIDAMIDPIVIDIRRKPALREPMSQAQAIDRAVRQCESAQTRARGLEALQKIIDESPDSPSATLAQAQLDHFQSL